MASKATLRIVVSFLVGASLAIGVVRIIDYVNTTQAIDASQDTIEYITEQVVKLRAAYNDHISRLVIKNNDLRKELKDIPIKLVETIKVVEKEVTVEVPVYVEELPDAEGYVLWFTTTELPDEDNLYIEGKIVLDHYDVREVSSPSASVTQLEHSIPIQIVETVDGQWYVSTTSPHVTFDDVSVVERPDSDNVFVGAHIAGYTLPDIGIGLDAMYRGWYGGLEYLFKEGDLRLELGYGLEF